MFFPSLVWQLEYLICSDDFVTQCALTSSRVAGMIFAALGLFFALVNITFLALFYQNSSDNKKDSLNCENPMFILLLNFYKVVFSVFVSFKSSDYAYYFSFLVITFLSNGYFIYSLLFGTGYLAFQTNYIRKVFTIFQIAYFSQIVAMLLEEVLR